MLVTWVDGVLTNEREVTLPFNPADAEHRYRIDRHRNRVTFSVDGVAYAEFTSRLPRRAMHVYVNAWYPKWLEPHVAADPVMTVSGFGSVP